MATLQTILEVLGRGGLATKREWQEAAKGPDALRESFRKADEEGKKIPRTLRVVSTAANELKANLQSSASSLGPLGTSLASIGPLGLAAAAGIGAIGKVLGDSLRFQREFEKGLANLSAITGATGKDLDFLKRQALELGKTTTSSAIETVEAFKLIASAKPELLENREALAAVTQEAIALAEASGTTVPDAARLLTTSLNQFGVGADQASRFVNVLAAGVKFGAAEIPDLSIALVKAGTEAKGAGLSFEQFNAILQKLAAFGTPAEKIGTSLRNIFLKLQEGADGTNPKIVGVSKALESLAAQQLTVTQLTDRFGTENVTVIQQLLQVAGAVDGFTQSLTGTNEAYQQQAINTASLDGALSRLGGAYDVLKVALVSNNSALTEFVNLSARVLAGTADIITGARALGDSTQFVDPLTQAYGDLAGAVLAVNFDQVHQQSVELAASTVSLSEAIGFQTDALHNQAAALRDVWAEATNATGAFDALQKAQAGARQASLDSITEKELEIAANKEAAKQQLDEVGRQRLVIQWKLEAKGVTTEQAKEEARLTTVLNEQTSARRAAAAATRKAPREQARDANNDAAVIAKIRELETAAQHEELTGIAKIAASRDQAYLQWAEFARKRGATEAQLAAGNLAIWKDYNNEELGLRDDFEQDLQQLEIESADAGLSQLDRLVLARDKAYEHFKDLERDKNATEDQVARASLAIAQRYETQRAQILQRESDKLAEQLARPVNDALEGIVDVGENAFEALANNSSVTFRDIAGDLKGVIFRALFDIAKQQILVSIGAQVTGVGGGGFGGGGGGGGGSLGGGLSLLQTGQQILSFGKTLYGGFEALGTGISSLVSGIGGLTSATTGATTAIETVGFTGEAGFTGAVAPGAASFEGGGGVASSAGGAASGIAGAASSAAILFAIVSALETVGAAVNVSKARDSFFTDKDAAKVANASFDPITRGIGNILTTILTGQKASTLFESQQRALYGGASAKDIAYTTILNILNPLNFAIGIAGKLPTKGTALRKTAEEYLEKDGVAAGFFGANSGTFKRGIGQTGLSANDVHGGDLSPAERAVLGGGARGLAGPTGTDFAKFLNQFGDNIETFTKLTADSGKEVTAFSAVFRAFVGGKAGHEDSRVPGIRADFLGSAVVAGAGDADIRDAAEQGLLGLGPLTRSFDKFKEFFLSPDNDIAIEDMKDTLQGFAVVAGGDVAQGVDKAAIALRKFNEIGIKDLSLDQITDQIAAANAEANAIGPGIRSAYFAGLNDPDSQDLDLSSLEDAVFDSASEGLKQAVEENAFDTFIQDAFKGDILGPVLQQFASVKEKLAAKTITEAEANKLLADATKDSRAALEQMRPLFAAALQAGRDLASIFDDAADSADEAKKAIADAFDDDIQRKTLNILSPRLAAQLDLELGQRERLKAARDAGADIAAVERLNGLERTALAEQNAQELTRITEQRDEQIARVQEQFQERVRRGLASLRDLATSLTATTASPLAPEEAFANAQTRLSSLFSAAEHGDADALEKLPDAFQAAQDLASQLFGTTSKFFDFFTPALARLQATGALNEKSFELPPGDRATIAAIEAEAQKQIAAIEKDTAAAMLIYNAILAAFPLDKNGVQTSDSAGKPGSSDVVTQGRPSPGPANGPSTGRYDLGSIEQQSYQAVLAAATPGGAVERALLAMQASGAGFDDSEYGALLAKAFSGAHSASAQENVIGASLEKIHNPSKFQPVLGFIREGNFRYNGPDSIPLIPGRVHIAPGESATVTRGDIEGGLRRIAEAEQATRSAMIATQKALQEEMEGFRRDFGAVATAYRGWLDRERSRTRVGA